MKRPFVRRALAGMAITLLVLAGCARTGSDAGAATASAPITPALIPAPAALQAEIARKLDAMIAKAEAGGAA